MTLFQHVPILVLLGMISALHVAGFFLEGLFHKILSALNVLLHAAAVLMMLYFGVAVEEALAVMLASSILALSLGLLSTRKQADTADSTKEGTEA